MLGIDIGPSETETFWTAFLRKLARRGLRGVKLVISDAHEVIKAAVSRVLNVTWQRCRVHSWATCWRMPAKAGAASSPPSSPPPLPIPGPPGRSGAGSLTNSVPNSLSPPLARECASGPAVFHARYTGCHLVGISVGIENNWYRKILYIQMLACLVDYRPGAPFGRSPACFTLKIKLKPPFALRRRPARSVGIRPLFPAPEAGSERRQTLK